jgi:DNA-binding winged helix-turn-helix (wHTH) protein
MDQRGSADFLRFDGFRFDRRRGGCLYRLDRAGVAEPVQLRGRALSLLGLLLERRGELLSKDEIMKAVWPGRAVEEGNLNVQIANLRQLLDEDREQGSCIQTVHGHGYRFVAPVTPETGRLIAAPADGGDGPGPRLLIVVLPFAELSEGRLQQYFAHRIAGDLTIDLSPIADVLVISHCTCATDQNKPVEMKIRRANGAERGPPRRRPLESI